MATHRWYWIKEKIVEYDFKRVSEIYLMKETDYEAMINMFREVERAQKDAFRQKLADSRARQMTYQFSLDEDRDRMLQFFGSTSPAYVIDNCIKLYEIHFGTEMDTNEGRYCLYKFYCSACINVLSDRLNIDAYELFAQLIDHLKTNSRYIGLSSPKYPQSKIDGFVMYLSPASRFFSSPRFETPSPVQHAEWFTSPQHRLSPNAGAIGSPSLSSRTPQRQLIRSPQPGCSQWSPWSVSSQQLIELQHSIEAPQSIEPHQAEPLTQLTQSPSTIIVDHEHVRKQFVDLVGKTINAALHNGELKFQEFIHKIADVNSTDSLKTNGTIYFMLTETMAGIFDGLIQTEVNVYSCIISHILLFHTNSTICLPPF